MAAEIEAAPISVSIPELPRILVWDVRVCRGITAVPYIVSTGFNANVVRNISSPLLMGAAAAAPKNSITLNFFL